jgi:crotonobetainyl-CoA:carnitine CoA-transferase CaiB-like acyl-CoA transferase
MVWVKRLIREADVVTHNFRPGVMAKAGLDYEAVKSLNPKIIYAEITGYGTEGPWKGKPGQDLLLQSLSGLTYTSGDAEDDPIPFGIAIADIMCGAHLVQGILAALIRRQKKGIGAKVEVSLMESLLDFQFELLTTYYSSGSQPQRSKLNNGHSLLGAPYGLFQTADGFIALSMMPLAKLSAALDCPELQEFSQDDTFRLRDEIKEVLGAFLLQKSSDYWLEKLRIHDIWSMPVLNWKQLKEQEAYRVLQMEQTIRAGENEVVTTRCPIRVNGERLFSKKGAPMLGAQTEKIKAEILNNAL